MSAILEEDEFRLRQKRLQRIADRRHEIMRRIAVAPDDRHLARTRGIGLLRRRHQGLIGVAEAKAAAAIEAGDRLFGEPRRESRARRRQSDLIPMARHHMIERAHEHLPDIGPPNQIHAIRPRRPFLRLRDRHGLLQHEMAHAIRPRRREGDAGEAAEAGHVQHSVSYVELREEFVEDLAIARRRRSESPISRRIGRNRASPRK